MAEVTYDNASEMLIEAVPELRPAYDKEIEWWGDEKPGRYIIYEGILQPFVIALLKENGSDEPLARVFDFLEPLVDQDDDFELSNLVGLALLDVLVSDPDLWERSQEFMGPKTLELARAIKAAREA